MLEGFFVVADVWALVHDDTLLSMSNILQLQALPCASTNKNVFLEVMLCIMVHNLSICRQTYFLQSYGRALTK